MDQNVGSLIQRPPYSGVPGTTDPAGPVHLAGLELARRQAEMSADRSGVAELARVVHAGSEGQSDKWANARHCHQPLASGAGFGPRSNLLVQSCNLAVDVLDHGGERSQQRRQGLVVQRLCQQDLESRAGQFGWLQPFHLQDGPDDVARVERLPPELLAHRQQGTVALGGHRLHRHGPELVDPHQVCDATGIVLVGLVAEPGFKRRRGMRCVNDDDWQLGFEQPPRDPGRVDASFETDPLDLTTGRHDHRGDLLRRAHNGLLANHLARRIHDAHGRARNRNIQSDIRHDRLLTVGTSAGAQRQAAAARSPQQPRRRGDPILFRRSNGFVEWTLVRCWTGKSMCASTSASLSSMKAPSCGHFARS